MKAVALMSGGLDSTLAAKIVAGLGVEVLGVYFSHPFCAREKKTEQALRELAAALAGQVGIALRVVRLDEEFLEIVLHPAHGFGSNINPCIDCRILMLKKARTIMEREHASFLVTGEVLGQRPMSQQRQTMQKIDRDAGVDDIVLRPLSAKLLPETAAERNGWIDRRKLYAFSGRSRKPQIDLAVMNGIIDFPNAAGGCLLTDPRFSDRAKDLMRSGGFTMDNVELLKLGRHFRLSERAKLVVGRDKDENAAIAALARNGDMLIEAAADIPGPTGLCRGACAEAELRTACAVVCRYCDRKGRDILEMTVGLAGGVSRTVTASPASEEELERMRI